MTFLLAYWRQALIGVICVAAVAWCTQRDERLRHQGEARILRAQVATLEKNYAALSDSLEQAREGIRVRVDTARVIITRTVADTVEVERLVDEIREVVPDSVFQKVEQLEAAYSDAVDALTLARVTIDELVGQNDLLTRANANLEAQVAALNAAQPKGKGWLDTGVKVLAGVGVGYALASR